MIEAPASPAARAASATSALLLGNAGCCGRGEAPVTAQVMMTLSRKRISPISTLPV